MADKNKISITTALMPAYYKDFQCKGGDCRDSCCKMNWRIDFDKRDFLRLRRLEVPAEYKSRLEGAIRRMRGKDIRAGMYAQLDMSAGVCPLFTEDGFCSLQRQCGGDVLPKVCRVFPRVERYTPAAREYALSPACEAVLELLWNLPDGVDFIEEDLPLKDQRGYIVRAEGSLELRFPEVRSLCVDILQARRLSLPKRMLFLGVSLQRLMDGEWSEAGVTAWLRETEARLGAPELAAAMEGLSGDRMKFMLQNVRNAMKMAPSEPDLVGEMLSAIASGAKSDGKMQMNLGLYQKVVERFDEAFGDIEYFFENLMVGLVIQRYFPDLRDKERLWQGYVNLCNLYSFYRFAAVTGCAEEETKERLFHVLTVVSCTLLHNERRQQQLRDEFFQNDSATLAHMAVLLTE